MKSLTSLFCKFIISTTTLIINFTASAQVHVKGYYRSNGTYVQPHERTRPNNTVTDNYSYPGNFNQNPAKVTEGYNNSPSSAQYSPGTSGSPDSNASNNRSSNNSSNYTRRYSGNYPYTTRFDNPTILPPLRSLPTPSSPEVYTCSKNASVNVLEEVVNTGYCKVTVDGRTGYVSQALLRLPNEAYAPTTSFAPVRSISSYTGSIIPTNFQTRFNNPTITPPLRSAPTPEAEEIYSCPKTSVVYVLGDVPNSGYCKVSVNDHIGFVSKMLLVQRP